MDSLTQAVLGAAVGQAALGQRVGRRAIVWGALLGTLPDLDSLYPFAGPVASFTWHRGYSHSLLCLTLAAPLLAALAWRLHRGGGARYRDWLALAWLCLITHPLLDAFTQYGTQLLLPFSDHPYALGSIFIIDPVYTLPLLGAVALVALRGARDRRACAATVLALAASTIYLFAGPLLQQRVRDDASATLAARETGPYKLLVQAAPFTTLLWRVVARTDAGYYEGFRSLFDPADTLVLHWHPSRDDLILALAGETDVERLRWFTRGFYAVEDLDGAVVLTDIRLGVWPNYVFSFTVGSTHAGLVEAGVTVRRPVPRASLRALPQLVRRVVDPAVELDFGRAARFVCGAPPATDGTCRG